MKIRETDNWILAIKLSIPVLIFFAGYLYHNPSPLIPTGFIQFDNVSYIAYAKEYLDAPGFHLLYSNPFDIESGPIYFQPQTLFFALLLWLGIPAGWILIPFTIICAIISFRIIISIYDSLTFQPSNRILQIWLLSWGGGILALAGMVAGAYLNDNAFGNLFILDPENGWWGLNFGRSLLFSCEAYYHALFLGIILGVIKKKYLLTAFLLFILSLSHPFTGIEIGGIILAWCVFEWFFNKKNIPLWFIISVLAVLAFHLFYYLYFLELFNDHQSVRAQYSLNWRLRYYRMIPAYGIVGILAISSVYFQSVRKFFESRNNRLLTCWFAVAFFLANHEWFMEPKQPVHFTRGYVWTSLMLIGLPALNRLVIYIKKRWLIHGIFLCLIFLSDNILWIYHTFSSTPVHPDPTYISEEQENVLEILDKESSNKVLIVSEDAAITMLSTVQTDGYPFYSHPFTTPFARNKYRIQQQLFKNGKTDSSFFKQKTNFVLKKSDTVALKALEDIYKEKIIKTNNYIILVTDPGH